MAFDREHVVMLVRRWQAERWKLKKRSDQRRQRITVHPDVKQRGLSYPL